MSLTLNENIVTKNMTCCPCDTFDLVSRHAGAQWAARYWTEVLTKTNS